MSVIKHKRGEFPVSDRFALFCPPDLLRATHDALEAERRGWYNLSNSRAPWPLTAEEEARLRQITHVINVHRSLDVFDDWTPGAMGHDHADSLHGNMRTHACGCMVHVAVCHYGERPAHGHRSVRKCFSHHGHTDPHEHLKALEV